MKETGYVKSAEEDMQIAATQPKGVRGVGRQQPGHNESSLVEHSDVTTAPSHVRQKVIYIQTQQVRSVCLFLELS
jgi:hypothetical protein